MSAEDSQSTISSDPTLESMSLLGKGFTMAKNNAASGLNYMKNTLHQSGNNTENSVSMFVMLIIFLAFWRLNRHGSG